MWKILFIKVINFENNWKDFCTDNCKTEITKLIEYNNNKPLNECFQLKELNSM